MALRQCILENWDFAFGSDVRCLTQSRAVHLPHTWSIEDDGQYLTGTGWYRTCLKAGTSGPEERTFLRFRGAYRDTHIFVNGREAGSHTGSGYTPFVMEITAFMKPDADTEIVVRVDNRFSTEALPYDHSFDWANDGGLFRPVELHITGPAALRDAEITAKPVILPLLRRQDRGQAVFGFCMQADGLTSDTMACWALYRGATDSIIEVQHTPMLSGCLACNGSIRLPERLVPDIRYWHFDAPELYTLVVRLRLPDGRISDCGTWCIGFRSLEVHGDTWRFNGETVRLPGMEWMPGSDPDFGMAETQDSLESMLVLLKESNSVLTRFHWQQDDWVYDWCDRHGLLVQEEIPFWGKQPEGDPDTLWPVIRQQLTEMVTAHRHHPSIIAWGTGNELSAQTWSVRQYIRRAVAFVHRLDETRLVNYVTNTAFGAPHDDGTEDGDVLMINDYIGTWHAGYEQDTAWQALLDAHPGRVFIPSEFGLCEPAFDGGDARRKSIFLEKLACYRGIPAIAGTVYFCLNDYRTHMGEEGQGREKRRVHGSTDLYGNPKASFFTVCTEHAPLIADKNDQGLRLTCRQDLPCYTVSGYILDTGHVRIPIPELRPGETWLCTEPLGHRARILRKNGDCVLDL